MTTNSFTPEYVPPHLAGRVSDFRRDTSGNVSFSDPKSALGTFGPEASRVTVTPDVFNSTFTGAGWTDLGHTVNNQYGAEKPPATFGTTIRDFVTGNVRKGLDYGLSSQGRTVGTAGLLAGLAGGAWGTLGENGSIGKGLVSSLIAGGGAAALTALFQGEANRQSSSLAKSAYADTDLLSLLSTDSSIPDHQKRQYLAAFQRLSRNEQSELSRMVRMVGGFGVGAVIARYLGGKGLLATAVGGMLGALVGRATGPQQSYNRLGQLSVLNLYR